MSQAYGKAVFAVIFFALFIGGMQVINGWQMDMVTLASIPVVLSAEAIVLGMMYATIYHGMEHDEAAAKPVKAMRTQTVAMGSQFEKRRTA